MPKVSLRDNILEAGLRVMFRKGYGGAGVRDIVAEASAPQGSFTNHFRSKEAFAGEVLDRYFVYLKGSSARHWTTRRSRHASGCGVTSTSSRDASRRTAFDAVA